jgi:putative transposase
MTKLNKKRMKWLVDQVVKHNKKAKEIGSVYGITERRVQQITKEFKDTKKYPELNYNRRPKTYLASEQEQIIESAYRETMLSPKLLYYEIKRRGGYAPKNKMYFL